MAWLRNGTPTAGTSNSVKDATVPTGTVSTDYVLLVATGSTGGSPTTPTSCTFTKVGGGGTFTQLVAATGLNNSWISVWKATGLTAGDTIRMTLNNTYLGFFAHTYWDTDPGTAQGTLYNRGGSSLSTTVSPAIATGVASGDKFINVSTERTTADGTTVSSRTNSAGFTVTNRYYYEEATSTDSSIDVSEFTVSSGSTTGTVTTTYASASGNGGSIILKQDAPPPPTPTVDLLWPNSFEANAVRVGFKVTNSSSTKLAVSTSSGMTSPTKSSAVTTTDGLWHTARVTGLSANTQYYVQMECDGTLVGDIMAIKTLDPGTVKTFTFLTGSCQDTGSNHVVFDRMATETADFFVHQGDIHYADTGVEATWRSAFLSSMNTAKFKAMRAKWAMDYVYDNHDWAGQGNEADDWTGTDPTDMVRELAGEYSVSGNLYKQWAHGRVRFFHTDLWGERDPDEATESSSKRAMSQAQEDQFLADLAAAKEPLLIWFAHWPLYTTTGNGRWGSYTTQRDRIKAWLDARPGIRNRLVAIGGDSHSVSSDSGANQTAFGRLPTLNASPLNKTGSTTPSGTWDIVNYDVPDANGVYSKCTVTDTGRKITIQWDAILDDGTNVGTWSRSVGTPTVWDGSAEQPATVYTWDGTLEQPASFTIN